LPTPIGTRVRATEESWFPNATGTIIEYVQNEVEDFEWYGVRIDNASRFEDSWWAFEPSELTLEDGGEVEPL
jgi:hypothetical protein